MPRFFTSWVWEHCERSEDGLQATCKLCDQVLQIKGSTSSLNKHLTAVHGLAITEEVIPRKRSKYADVNNEDNPMDIDASVESNIATVNSGPSTSDSCADSQTGDASNIRAESGTSGTCGRGSRSTNPRGRVRSVSSSTRTDRPCSRDRMELITQSLTKMIVSDMLPVSFINGTGFRQFMEVVEPNYKVPCRKTFRNRLVYLHEQVAAKISTELSAVSFVAWTSDCWSSRSQDSYISVTTHFVDPDWVPKGYTLSTEELSERHTAANLTAKLQQIMTKWNLEGKVSAIVTDNARNATNSVRDLDSLLIHNGVTCAAHSLQLCVTTALKNEALIAVCEKAAKLVSHFRHSNIATAALEQKQEQLGLAKLKLIQSCSTRWDSTYAMIDRLLSNRGAVINVLSDRTVTSRATAERLEISEREWWLMENLHTVLKPLQVATTVFCGDSHSPISMVRPIVSVLRGSHLCECDEDDSVIASVKETLREELTTRFELEYNCLLGVNARQVASFLDPRYKDLVVESTQARSDIQSFVRRQLSANSEEDGENQSFETAMDFLFHMAPKRNSAEAQFDMYVAEPQISHNMNPFEWWATRERRYPAIAELARKYLCIPATSASSERVFSTAGNVVTSKRNCLLPENVNILVFLYQNRRLL